MKNKLAMRLKLLALSALLCAPAPQLLAQTTPVLKAERSGEKLILSWSGGQNIRLQSSSCLCGPYWQYLPDSDTNCVVEAALNEPAAFFRLVDTLADTDADLLTRAEEEAGWTIFIDTSGYSDPRIIAGRLVTSDPDLADTDGDGLDDFLEWIYGTDPRAADTDHDGLSDSEEVFRWHTSPASADTDGDSRGPDHNLPPKAALFDGNELRLLHTSPTLEDTDGDGRTDYEEYDQLGRSPLVAQLPNIEVRLVDAVDIRLDVQYAESAGQSHQYGSQITTSTTTTEKDAWTHTLQWSLKLGAKSKFGLFSGAEGEFSTEFTFGSSHSYTSEKSTAEMTQKAITDYTTDSRTRTETAASGSMSAGVQLVNTGPVTYTLTDLGVTVRYWSPGPDTTNRSFKTLATLVPALAAGGITLAPGDSTPVLQVQASGLNASRVKEFMARPNSLYLEPAFYELENAQGLNFDFLEEVTRWRTARVEIDYGDGRNEQFRVATNVERTDDGGYAGIPMGTVLSNILRIPFQTVPLRSLGGEPSDRRVLHAVRDCVTTSPSNGFWIVASSSRTTPLETPDFENITLHAGDQILLAFIRDEDGDGLFAPEEQHHGTLDTATPDGSQTADSDRDGLTDVFEARAGWDVVVLSRTNHVYSDPRQTDQDGDGLTDLQEYQLGTDPARPDTDDDGLPDSRDPHPLVPAKVLRVKADAFAGGNSPTNGATWASAFTNLQDALTQARNGAATATNSDDVAEIWVAAGTYRPATSTTNRSARFELVNNIALYGGFTGLETKLSQRNPDPLFNGTVLTGDLMNNDASTYDGNAASFADNCTNVCYAATNVGTGALLDGFTITGGNASLSTQGGGGLFTRGYPRLKNLLFRANYGYFGGGLFLSPVAPGELSVSDCLFLQNDAYHGGGIGLPTVNPVPQPAPPQPMPVRRERGRLRRRRLCLRTQNRDTRDAFHRSLHFWPELRDHPGRGGLCA